jgi:hypothetical protein
MAEMSFSELRPPPGSMGADHIARFKAMLGGVKDAAGIGADVAAVIAVVLTLHGTAPDDTCKVRLTKANESIEMIVPCKAASSQAFLGTVSKFVGDGPGGPLKVRVTPSAKPGP